MIILSALIVKKNQIASQVNEESETRYLSFFCLDSKEG
jgi:hypothetical protein